MATTNGNSKNRRYLVENITRGRQLATNALLANESKTRREGLLKRTELPPGEGLLISPCEAVHTWYSSAHLCTCS